MSIPKGKVALTYAHQAGAFVTRMATLAIVTPLLATHKDLYGIYSVCMSLMFFLNYADIGFLAAAKKHAASFAAEGRIDLEQRYLGFGLMISLVGGVLFALICSVAMFHPELLFHDISDTSDEHVAFFLLLFTALSAPLVVAQRILAVSFEIRIEGFIPQRWAMAGNILALVVGVFVLKGGRESVVLYYGISQGLGGMVLWITSWEARRRHGYGLVALLRNARWDARVFGHLRNLTVAGTWATIMWVLFYELDMVYVGAMLDLSIGAGFGVALTILSVFRVINGLLYLPFATQANRIVGVADSGAFRTFIRKMLCDLAPFILYPALSVSILAHPLVHAWVGEQYGDSVGLVRILSLTFALSFLGYPWDILIVSQERNVERILTSTMQTVGFWGLVIFVWRTDTQGIAWAKWIMCAIFQVVALFRIATFLNEPPIRLLRVILDRTAFGGVALVGSALVLGQWLPTVKSLGNLCLVGAGLVATILSGFLAQAWASKETRMMIASMLGRKMPPEKAV